MNLKELDGLFKDYAKDGDGDPVRHALDDYQSQAKYPGAEFWSLAAAFYLKDGDIPRLCDALDQWKKCKGDPIEPYEWYCDLGRQGSVPKSVLKQNLEVLLKRKPNDPSSLRIAYGIAMDEDNWARRLFYALELSKHGKTAADFVRYGIECGRNAMPERAEEAFGKALELDPNNASAVIGLGLSAFERMELGKAEECFRRALKVDPESEWAQQELAKIARIRKGEPWSKRADARRKFWKHWQDTELVRLSDEQRRKRMAEVVAGRR